MQCREGFAARLRGSDPVIQAKACAYIEEPGNTFSRKVEKCYRLVGSRLPSIQYLDTFNNHCLVRLFVFLIEKRLIDQFNGRREPFFEL